MQLAMVGLGRMGANMVRRLLAAGHDCVVFDMSPKAVEELVQQRAVGASSVAELVKKIEEAPGDLADGPGGGRRCHHCGALPASRARRHPDRWWQFLLRGRHSPGKGAELETDPLCRCRHERRRVGSGARLLHDDRRRPRGGRSISIRSSRHWRRAAGDIPRTPGRDRTGGTAEHGYLHCGPNGAGHFVKMVHNGIEYGIMAAYAEGLGVLRHANVGKQTACDRCRDNAVARPGALSV